MRIALGRRRVSDPCKRTAVAIAVALVASSCGFFGDDGLTPMTLKPLGGKVFIVRGGESIPVVETVEIEAQDIVNTSANGLARFALEGDRTVLVNNDTAVRIINGGAVEAQSGSILARAGRDSTRVRFGSVDATASKTWLRVDVLPGSTRAATYRGRTELKAPGEVPVTVPALHQTLVVADDFRDVRPYRLKPRDAWDLEVLGELIELDRQLVQLAKGLSLQLKDERPDLAYFARLLDGNASFVKPYLQKRVVDLLIGFTIATQSEERPGAALEEAFDLREQDAKWGIVAGIMRVPPQGVVAQLEATVEGIPGVAAAGPEGEEVDFDGANGELDGVVIGSGDPDADPGDPGDPPSDDPGPGPGPDPPPPTKPPATEDPECVDVIECTIEEAELPPTPEPTPTGGPLDWN